MAKHIKTKCVRLAVGRKESQEMGVLLTDVLIQTKDITDEDYAGNVIEKKNIKISNKTGPRKLTKPSTKREPQ